MGSEMCIRDSGIIFASFWAYGQYGKGMVFFSEAEPQYAQIQIKSRGNLSIEETNKLVLDVEQRILQVADIKAINSYAQTPGSNTRDLDRIGGAFLEMHAEAERDRGGNAILEEIRERTAGIPGVIVEVQEMEQGPPVGKPCLLYTSPSPRDGLLSRMPSSA